MKLTARQQEVAELAAKGYGYRKIGAELKVSHYTVRTHIIAIANKLPGDGTNPLRTVMRWMLAEAPSTRGAA